MMRTILLGLPILRFVAVFATLFAAWPATADDASLAPHEAAMVAQCNEFRAQQGLRPLVPARWLMERARSHTRWMLGHGMIHSSGVQENIAMGQPGVASVTQTWINSAGHNANMRTGATHIGVAGYLSPNGTPFWCQQFGGPTGNPAAVEGGGSTSGGRRFLGRFRR